MPFYVKCVILKKDMWSKTHVQVTKSVEYFNVKEDFQMKFVLVCERYDSCFTKQVQRYLDEGYELRGKTFTTTKKHCQEVECYYNQVLVKNNNDETEKNEDK